MEKQARASGQARPGPAVLGRERHAEAPREPSRLGQPAPVRAPRVAASRGRATALNGPQWPPGSRERGPSQPATVQTSAFCRSRRPGAPHRHLPPAAALHRRPGSQSVASRRVPASAPFTELVPIGPPGAPERPGLSRQRRATRHGDPVRRQMCSSRAALPLTRFGDSGQLTSVCNSAAAPVRQRPGNDPLRGPRGQTG